MLIKPIPEKPARVSRTYIREVFGELGLNLSSDALRVLGGAADAYLSDIFRTGAAILSTGPQCTFKVAHLRLAVELEDRKLRRCMGAGISYPGAAHRTPGL